MAAFMNLILALALALIIPCLQRVAPAVAAIPSPPAIAAAPADAVGSLRPRVAPCSSPGAARSPSHTVKVVVAREATNAEFEVRCIALPAPESPRVWRWTDA